MALLWVAPGLAVWLAMLAGNGVGLVDLGLIDILLCFALAFVVPLNLARLRSSGVSVGPLPVVGTAALAIASFGLTPGAAAAGLAVPWLMVCLWIGLRGVLELWSSRSLHPSHLLPAASVAYLVVGASWLVISRLGSRPMGLSPEIVELTAVHFHFAGFAAPLFAIATAEILEARSLRLARIALTAGMGVIAAMPVVAIGFFAPQFVSAAGAFLLAAALWVLAGLMIRAAAALKGARRVLLTIAALAVIGPMALALEYAAGPLFGLPILSIPEMARLHGMANAFGFSGCATLAFSPGPLKYTRHTST